MEQNPLEIIKSPISEKQKRKLNISAGTGYGLFLGFGLAVFAWGYDGLLLVLNSTTFPWIKLVIGLPLSMLIGGLAGRMAALTDSTGIQVAIWAAAGWLFGNLAGHIPFEGTNLAIWVIKPNLRGEIIYSFEHSASVRTILTVLMTTLLGVVSGFIENPVITWSWDHSKPDGRLSAKSWIILFSGIPLALLMAVAVDSFINQPLRKHNVAVGGLIQQALSGEIDTEHLNYRTISPFIDILSDQYLIHFVAFGGDKKSWYSAYVDVEFDDGNLLRCATSGDNVIYCDDFFEKYRLWMVDLINAGFTGNRPWLDAKVKRLDVNETVMSQLNTYSSRMDGPNNITMIDELYGWIYMAAEFDSGYELVCRFHDAAPVVVDQCIGSDQ